MTTDLDAVRRAVVAAGLTGAKASGQVNVRLLEPEFNGSGKMTHGWFKFYATAADCLSDATGIMVLEVIQIYDGQGNLATYRAFESEEPEPGDEGG